MQTITPALEAILKAHFQAAADGFRARLEVAIPIPASPPGSPTVIQTAYGYSVTPASFAAVVTPGNTIIALCSSRSPTGHGNMFAAGASAWVDVAYADLTIPTDHRGGYISYRVVTADPTEASSGGDGKTFTSSRGDDRVALIEVEGEYASIYVSQDNEPASTLVDCGGNITPSTGVPTLIVGVSVYGPKNYASYPNVTPDSDVVEVGDAGNGPHHWAAYRQVDDPDGGAYSVAGTISAAYAFCGVTAAFTSIAGGGTPASETWTPYRVRSVSVDKSLRMVADQAEAVLASEDYAFGWGAESIFRTNQRCRIFQWYGDDANEVQTFFGLIDRIADSRDLPQTSLAIRDMMAVLIDQTFSATAPQQATETGAVRTAANGVYLNMEVSDIVDDILDRAGWPTDDREITVTSYVLDEFIINDGSSWADAIIGDEQLSGLVGYSAWADESGVFHFAPTLVSQNLTDPTTPAYTFRSGEGIVSLDDETDQYELRTRIKVRGPLTTTTLQDTWRELWRTSKFHAPVGLWHDPSSPANLRVLDRGTKRLYTLRQSDRVVLISYSISAICPHPLGLSGDPADASVYWLLNAPWIDGISGGNKVKKVRKSDNVVLATFSLPSGNISAIKVSSSYLYYTNLSTDRFYRVNKTTGAAVANYSHSYNGVTQANPSGMMVNGTTLYLFWANGGSTARFLLCDESAPGTVTDVVKTAGTNLHGGEMDTVTDIDCYGDSDSLGLVAKFTLAEKVDITNEVYAEAVDTDLEDELGLYAGLSDREHDTHPTDDDHPFEVRRLTLDLSVITSLAQATETAQRQLDIASQRRRVVDTGIVGNPALQKTDLVVVEDPVSGINESFAIDTYRTQMDADGTYLGTMALRPVEDLDDDPEDGGSAGS